MDQPKDASPTIEQMLEMVFRSIKELNNAFFQLNAKIDIVKEVLVELHPELESQLEERIRKAQGDSTKEFATLQKILEILGTKPSGPVQ